MNLVCGIDWSERHHDVAVVDGNGTVVVKAQIANDANGFTQLLELLAGAGDTKTEPIPVAIETDRGLLVACLRSTGRKIYPINPLAASRYRARHTLSRAKSDHADAVMLANIIRLDAAAHRELPADSDLAMAIRVLARAQQDAVWSRVQLGNQLRSMLQEYFPAALHAFGSLRGGGLARPEARTILAFAPTPALAVKLTLSQLQRLLKQAGRSRLLDRDAKHYQEVLRTVQPRQSPLVEDAMGIQTKALLRQFDAACQSADELEAAVSAYFAQHPDSEIIGSFPGLGALAGARVLAEIGDDRTRFADARGLKAFSGSAPITRASGKKSTITYRQIKNNRLAAVCPIWTLSAIRLSQGARRHYDHRRTVGDWHRAAQRNLFNKLIGQLYHCLQTRALFNETIAFPAPLLDT